MAGEADLRLRQGKLQGGHVALGLRQMADCTRNHHRGVYGLAAGFVPVTGGTIVLLVKNARVLDGASLHGQGQ